MTPIPQATLDTAPGRPDRAGRIAFLEGVRGVAAGLVVVQHLLESQFTGYRHWSMQWLNLGRIGVVAFFLVSGYVIPISLARQPIRTFAVRRIFRLFPAYWLALAVMVVIHADDVVGVVPAPVILLNVLMLQGLVGAVSVLPPAWTLSIELIFYGQSAVAKGRRLLAAAVHAGWAWLALYLLMCLAERVTGHDLPTTLPLLLYAASVGHGLHLRDSGPPRDDPAGGHHGVGRLTDPARVWLLLLVTGVVAVPAGAYLSVDGDGQWPPFTYAASFLVGVALFFGFHLARRHRLPAVLIFLGSISYAMYLCHPILMDVLRGPSVPHDPVVFLGASAVAVPLVAWLVHRFVEKPFIRIGRSLTGGGRRETAAASPASQP